MPEITKRALAAVMFTDIVGFTALMQQDEALARHKRDRHREVLEGSHKTHHGDIIQYFGDGSLSVFKSAVEAVACAIEIQRQLKHPLAVALRIGIHMGDIVFEKDSVFGDGVNIASRIESLSVPGAVMVSDSIYEHIQNQPQFNFRSLGKFQLKNVERPVELFALSNEGLTVPDVEALAGMGSQLEEDKSSLRNLPQKLSSFVGRQKEIKDIQQLLLENRLVTLTGPGGTGKTRLSLQVAAQVALHFQDGIFWVPLAAISDPSLVAYTIAKNLSLEQDPLLGMEEQLINFLKTKEALLILDNFEQIVRAAPLLEQLLQQCYQLKILVSSRIVLQLAGEVEYAVRPLPLPNNGISDTVLLKQYPAIELFCQRAKSARKHFKLTTENGQAVAEICARLDGLPLAIELAAARIKIFSPKAMLKRLNQRLDLKSSSQSLPARHHTIRNTISWSFDLLESEEKALFSRLSVFVGGVNLPAVEEVCGVNGLGEWDLADGVMALVDKSLIQQEENEEAELRFTMLETIREFASESLGLSPKADEIRQAHARYFLQLAEEAQPHLSGSEQEEWLAVFEAEQENFRAAIHYSSRHGHYETALRLGLALRPFWGNRGMTMEGVEQLEKLLELPVPEELIPIRLKLLEALGVLYTYIPKNVEARKMYLECLEYWRKTDNLQQTGLTLNHLAWITHHFGKIREAEMYNEEALKIWEQTGDRHHRMATINNRGWIRLAQCRTAEALASFTENMQTTKALSDDRRHAYALYHYGYTLFLRGHHREAIPYLEQGLVMHQRVKDKLGMGYAHGMLAFCFSRMKDLAASELHGREAELLGKEVNAHFVILSAFDQKCICALVKNKLEEAKKWNDGALKIAERIDTYRWNCNVWCTRARVSLAQKDLPLAKVSVRKLFQLDHNEENLAATIPALEFKAQLLAAEEKVEQAILCLAKAGALREKLELKLTPLDAPTVDQTREQLQKALGQKKYEALWQQGRQAALETLVDPT